uniref:Odorant receptor n=1 Tax=Cacopsylla melanoneura TaxID=428564 RepID=A0A8D9E9A1_9HEMI
MNYAQPLLKNRFLLQLMGLLDWEPFQQKWKNKCATIYKRTVHCVIIIALVSHFISTTTRSIRYMPEFYQRLVEDLAFNMWYMECVAYVKHDKQLIKVMKCMKTTFSKANRAVVKDCELKDKVYFWFIFIATTCTICGSILETYIPMPQEEIDLMAYVYKRNRPDRRLQTNFWIPFIDDSESYYFEVLFHVEFYLIFLVIIMGTVTLSAIPCW